MGLSIDSTYSHIAWVRNIEEKLGGPDPGGGQVDVRFLEGAPGSG